MKSGRHIVIAVLGLGLGVILGLVVARLLRSSRPQPRAVAALAVNDETLSMDDFVGELKVTYGPQALNLHVESMLVSQEAERLGLQLTDAEERSITQQVDDAPEDKHVRRMLGRRLRTALLWRKLLLRDVSEDEIRQVYELYARELRRYEVEAIIVPVVGDLEMIRAGIRQGVKFGDLATQYSTDASKSRGGKLGRLTAGDIERMFGADARYEIEKLTAGQVTAPVLTSRGTLLLRLEKVYTSFADLRSAAEDVLANARRVGVGYALQQNAKVSSPFMEDSAVSVPPPTPAGGQQ